MLRIAAAVAAAAALLAPATAPRAQDTPAAGEGIGVATFGSGCFWCTEADFDKIPGVLTTTSGYMGGKTPNPSYEQVGTGRTGHAEVLQLTYDKSKVGYEQLLAHYWRTTDVLDGTGQFCDRGSQYRPVIFTHTPEQLKLATEAKAALEKSRFAKPIAVGIAPATAFTAAEDYHQDYYKKNPLRYKIYRHGCGREARLEALWGAEAGK
jgi:methionine-S-sulfoxide reductase